MNEITEVQQNEIVNYDDIFAAEAAAEVENERGSVDILRFGQGHMHLEGVDIGTQLYVYVLDSVHLNTYYDTLYDSNNITPPACMAMFYGKDEDTAGPLPQSEKPQSERCHGCPQNEYGTNPNGRGSKACSNARKLMIIPAAAATPEGGLQAFTAAQILSQPIMSCRLPVMSCKKFSTYAKTLAGAHTRPLWSVVSLMAVKPNARTQFEVVFTCAEMVPKNDARLAALMQRHTEAKVLMQDLSEFLGRREEIEDNGKF